MAKGYVYILTNPCIRSLNGNPVVKVGFTRDLPRRLGCLNTSVPENFTVVGLFEVENYKDLEKWSKAYVGDSLTTSDGSSTEFFERTKEDVVSRIMKCCRHHHIKPRQIDGSVYIGRSSSAIRNNLKKAQSRRKIKPSVAPCRKHNDCTWNKGVTLLAKAIAEKHNGGKAVGHAVEILSGRFPVERGKWRDILTKVGVEFDETGHVVDWSKAKV